MDINYSKVTHITLETLQKYLDILINKNIGLYGIIITDIDGVIILKAISENKRDMSQLILNPLLSGIFTNLCESSKKLRQLGKTNFTISHIDSEVLIQVNFYPLIIRLFGDLNYEGEILNLIPLLKDCFSGIREGIELVLNFEDTRSS